MTFQTRTLSTGSTTDVDSVSVVSCIQDSPQDDTISVISDTEHLRSEALSEVSVKISDENDSDNDYQYGNESPKRVKFSNVSLREYNLCLGDNPSVTRGAPITLGWKYQTELYYQTIDEFEESQHSSLKTRRSRVCSKRPSLERLHLLKELGYSRVEIKEATDIAQAIKNQRLRTRRQVERSQQWNAILHSIRCFFICTERFRSTNDKLSESVSTISTARLSIDWSSHGANEDTSHKRHPKKETIRDRGLQRQESWQKRMQKHMQQKVWSHWSRRSHRDSLDIARHSTSIDLGISLDEITD